MKKKFKFAVIDRNDPIKIVCIDREEAHFEVKRLLDRNPDALWAIEELDDSEGPFFSWNDYPEYKPKRRRKYVDRTLDDAATERSIR